MRTSFFFSILFAVGLCLTASAQIKLPPGQGQPEPKPEDPMKTEAVCKVTFLDHANDWHIYISTREGEKIVGDVSESTHYDAFGSVLDAAQKLVTLGACSKVTF